MSEFVTKDQLKAVLERLSNTVVKSGDALPDEWYNLKLQVKGNTSGMNISGDSRPMDHRIASIKTIIENYDPELAVDSSRGFFYDRNVSLTAGGTLSFAKEPISPSSSYSTHYIKFDFGRMPSGTTIRVTNMSLQEINSDGTYGSNILSGFIKQNQSFKTKDWGETLIATATYSNNRLSVTVPTNIGGKEWQGYVVMRAVGAVDPSKKYKFSCSIYASNAGTCSVLLSDAYNASKYTMMLMRWRKGMWKAPFFSFSGENAIADNELTNWNILGNKAYWMNNSNLAYTFYALPLSTKAKPQTTDYVFKNANSSVMRIGCAIFKNTGVGTHGWQRVSNIAYVELHCKKNGSWRFSVRQE